MGKESSTAEEQEPNAYAGLTSHCILKSTQMASVLSTAAVVPAAVYAAYKGTAFSATQAATIVSRGTLVGSGVLSAMCLYKIMSLDEDGVKDRAYRIRHNEGQKRVDQVATLGGCTGAMAGGALVRAHGPRIIMAGFGAGSALGVLAHVVSHRPAEDKVAGA